MAIVDMSTFVVSRTLVLVHQTLIPLQTTVFT